MALGISSYIQILEPHANGGENRMGRFRNRFPTCQFTDVSFLSRGADTGTLPGRPEEVGRGPDHLALEASEVLEPWEEKQKSCI